MRKNKMEYEESAAPATTAREVLIATKWILENFGWTKAHFSRKNHHGELVSFCLVGAVEQVFTPENVKEKALNLIQSSIYDEGIYNSIIIYNDISSTTKEDIIRVLDRAISYEQ